MRVSRDPAARRRLVALCAVAAAATLAGVLVGSGAGDSDRAAPRTTPEASNARPRAAVDRLSLEQQVGQLLVISFDGVDPPDYVYRLLREGQAGGVILFGKNLPDAATLRASTERLQRAAGGRALIATDQEGGSIRSVAFAPPQSSQGALGTREAAAESAASAAVELRRAGINVNLAPVADVAAVTGSVVAGRAYPGDAAAVGPLVQAAVRAHSRRRVAATAKHFPGLGRARQNTDDAPVTIDAPRAELERSDLQAFRAASRAAVPLVMTSHALYPAYDRGRIASQSRVLIERVLRRQLGFKGAVITDSMEAEAVTSRSDVATAAERSVEAGTDLVLMTGSGSWKEVYPRLLRRARASAGFRARVRDAAARVIALKRRLGLPR